MLAGCAVGPDYKRPAMNFPATYKEDAGWKAATPSDGEKRGPWWEVFNDPVLNDLETQVATSNETIRQAAANYEAAAPDRPFRPHAVPAPDIGPRLRRSAHTRGAGRPCSPRRASRSGPETANLYTAELQASWEPDFWGKIRRTVEADVSAAQADAADLALTRLSTEATLAEDYIGLRVTDEKTRLLEDTVAAYTRTLKITHNKYDVGVAARSDVITAQTQLDGIRAQLIDLGIQRAQFEHAIAVLVGKAPADFSIARRAELGIATPEIPPQLASSLLERRPDVSAAEREAKAANAKIGIQKAAYYPDLSLTGAGGFEGSPADKLFTVPFRFWTLGAEATDALLDWGQRHDLVLSAEASYDASAANYRQTVLTALGQVEDNLAGLRILKDESVVQDTAVTEASQAAQIAPQRVQCRHRGLHDGGCGAGDRARRPRDGADDPPEPADLERRAHPGARGRVGRRPSSRSPEAAAVTPTKSWIGTAALLAALGAALGACARRESQVDADTKRQIIDCGNLDEPTDLDPQIINSNVDSNIAYTLFEGLTAYDPKDLHPVPGVAERWESNADATEWTFHLRAGAKWSNGDAVTAADFVYSYHRMLSPKLGAEYAAFLFHLKNAEGFFKGTVKDFSQVGARAVDARTLVLTLWHPLPYFPLPRLPPGLVPRPPGDHREVRGDGRAGDGVDEAGGISSATGRLSSPNGSRTRSSAWSSRPPTGTATPSACRGAISSPSRSPSTEEAAFRSGQLHTTILVPIDKIAGYRADPRGVLRQFGQLATYFYRPERQEASPGRRAGAPRPLARRGPPADHRRRHARQFHSRGKPDDAGDGGLRLKDLREHRCPRGPAPAGRGGLSGRQGVPQPRSPLQYERDASDDRRGHPADVAREPRHHVTLQNQRARSGTTRCARATTRSAATGWVGDYLDPSTFIDVMTSTNGNNQTGWGSAEYDRLDQLAHDDRGQRQAL